MQRFLLVSGMTLGRARPGLLRDLREEETISICRRHLPAEFPRIIVPVISSFVLSPTAASEVHKSGS